jgi:ribonuclease P protein subunit RPR2
VNHTAKQIAKQRIQTLFEQAILIRKTNPQLAQSYIGTARKIAMAARICLPTNYRRQICRNCNALLVPGESSRVRLRSRRESHVVITCLSCGSQTRIPLKSRQEIKEIEQDNNQNEASCSA